MPYYGFYGFDIYYLVLVVPCVILAFWAQARVKSTFSRYEQVLNRRGLTGAQAAEAVLRQNGVTGVRIEWVAGKLNDHFDPRTNTIRLRAAIIPVTQFGSAAAFPLIILGLFMNSGILIDIGIWAFALSTVFQLVTLPVEINASNRALAAIEQGGLLTGDEYPMAKKTLTAAAMTYVAALAVSLAQLLRLLLIFGGRGRDDR